MAIEDDFKWLVIWEACYTMRWQYSIFPAEITSKYIINVAEQDIVFHVLDTIIYYAQGVQGFS